MPAIVSGASGQLIKKRLVGEKYGPTGPPGPSGTSGSPGIPGLPGDPGEPGLLLDYLVHSVQLLDDGCFWQGKTSSESIERGFFLGVEEGLARFHVGDAFNFLKWDGANLYMGSPYLDINLNGNDVLSIKAGGNLSVLEGGNIHVDGGGSISVMDGGGLYVGNGGQVSVEGGTLRVKEYGGITLEGVYNNPGFIRFYTSYGDDFSISTTIMHDERTNEYLGLYDYFMLNTSAEYGNLLLGGTTAWVPDASGVSGKYEEHVDVGAFANILLNAYSTASMNLYKEPTLNANGGYNAPVSLGSIGLSNYTYKGMHAPSGMRTTIYLDIPGDARLTIDNNVFMGYDGGPKLTFFTLNENRLQVDKYGLKIGSWYNGGNPTSGYGIYPQTGTITRNSDGEHYVYISTKGWSKVLVEKSDSYRFGEGTTGNRGIRFEQVKTWGDGNNYWTIKTDDANTWGNFVALHFPHVPYLKSATNGYSGDTVGSRIRFSSKASSDRIIWDFGFISEDGYIRILAAETTVFKIGSTGDLWLDGGVGTTGTLNFGQKARQMINLWGTRYAIGVQASTLYLRTDSNFAIHVGGSHSDTAFDPGSGGKCVANYNGSAWNFYSAQALYADGSQIFLNRANSQDQLCAITAISSNIHLTVGLYLDKNSSWIHNGGSSNQSKNLVFRLDTTNGAYWYASDNSAPSWNVANNVQLWDIYGRWRGQVHLYGFGSNGMVGGSGDGATNTLFNLNIYSWWGIGFQCSLDGVTRIVFDTRSGKIRARQLYLNEYLQLEGTEGAQLFLSNSGGAAPASFFSLLSLSGYTYFCNNCYWWQGSWYNIGLGNNANIASAISFDSVGSLRLLRSTGNGAGAVITSWPLVKTLINENGFYVGGLAGQYDSGEQTIAANGGIAATVHNLGRKPSFVRIILRCKVAEGGFAVGDEVEHYSGAMYGGAWAGMEVFDDATYIGWRLGSYASGATGVFVLNNKSTGAAFWITMSSWRLIIQAY